MEEDIKILKEAINKMKRNNFIIQYKDLYIEKEIIGIIENALYRLEQLEKENVSKQKAYDDCYCEFKHYKQFDSIPKSVIAKKIEELEEHGGWEFADSRDVLLATDLLKELLGGSNE